MMERKHSLWAGVAIATTVVGIGCQLAHRTKRTSTTNGATTHAKA